MIAVIIAFVASSGFWGFLTVFLTRRNKHNKLLLGLANYRILEAGENYIKRGYITPHEFKNFTEYLWEPYKELGGDGLGEKIYSEVQSLPMSKHEKGDPGG